MNALLLRVHLQWNYATVPSHQQMIREELFVLLLLLLSCIVLRRHMGGCVGMNTRSTVLLSPIGVVRWVDGIA